MNNNSINEIIFVVPYSPEEELHCKGVSGHGKGSMGIYTDKMILVLEKFNFKCNILNIKVNGISYFKKIINPLFDSWSLIFSKEKIIYVQYAFFFNFIFLLPFLFISRFIIRKKVILHIHEYWKYLPFNKIVMFFDLLYCFVANDIIVHNNDQFLYLKKYKNKNIYLLYMPIDKSYITKKIIDDDKINILMHGSILRKKGFELGIKALNLLPEKYNLSIVGGIGDNIYYNELLNLINKLGIKNRIIFISKPLKNKEYEEYIEKANLIIYPYVIATASAALADGALKFEKSFLTSNIESFINYIGTNEFSFKSGDYNDLANKIQKIDLEKSKNYSKLVKEKYSWDNMGKQLLSIISN